MKVLTLTQPYATLVAIGAKRIETRRWRTHYRGSLYIHAAKGFPKTARRLCYTEPYHSALGRLTRDTELPRGMIIAQVNLTGCYPTRMPDGGAHSPIGDLVLPPPDPEYSFGDYSPGRYAWVLEDVEMLPVPIPARGHLGLWTWGYAA